MVHAGCVVKCEKFIPSLLHTALDRRAPPPPPTLRHPSRVNSMTEGSRHAIARLAVLCLFLGILDRLSAVSRFVVSGGGSFCVFVCDGHNLFARDNGILFLFSSFICSLERATELSKQVSMVLLGALKIASGMEGVDEKRGEIFRGGRARSESWGGEGIDLGRRK